MTGRNDKQKKVKTHNYIYNICIHSLSIDRIWSYTYIIHEWKKCIMTYIIHEWKKCIMTYIIYALSAKASRMTRIEYEAASAARQGKCVMTYLELPLNYVITYIMND